MSPDKGESHCGRWSRIGKVCCSARYKVTDGQECKQADYGSLLGYIKLTHKQSISSKRLEVLSITHWQSDGKARGISVEQINLTD